MVFFLQALKILLNGNTGCFVQFPQEVVALYLPSFLCTKHTDEWVKRLQLLQIPLLESAGYVNFVVACSPLSQGSCIFCNLGGYLLLLLWYGMLHGEPAGFQSSPMSARSLTPGMAQERKSVSMFPSPHTFIPPFSVCL